MKTTVRHNVKIGRKWVRVLSCAETESGVVEKEIARFLFSGDAYKYAKELAEKDMWSANEYIAVR